MFAGTNFDYDSETVTDVYGPFKSRAEAEEVIRAHAESEFARLQKQYPDAAMFDELTDDGTLEITFDDENDNGCLYQILEMKP